MSHKPVTEFATLFIKDGIDVDKPDTEAYDVWQSTLTVLAQQEGYVGSRYGVVDEDPSQLTLVVDWKDLSFHQAFMSSEVYSPFLAKLGNICTKPATLFHFYPSSSPPTILETAPVIEFVVFYGTEPEYLSRATQFAEKMIALKPEGFYGGGIGEVIEEIAKDGEDGEQGPAVVLYAGWENKEAHFQFRDTEGFKEHIYLLRTGLKGSYMRHIPFKLGKKPVKA